MTQKATLKPYLEEIRQWVEQGRTDVWIAHTLNSTPASISAFRSSHGILRRDIASEARTASPPGHPARRAARGVTDEAPPPDEEGRRRPAALGADGRPGARHRGGRRGARGDEDAPARKRRRRGGRGRKRPAGYEAVLDHGDEGYGFWLDGAVRDDPVFAEHWAGVRALSVRVEADQIVIRADDRG